MTLDSQLSVRIPGDLADRLDETAEARGVDRSEVVRRALQLYLEGVAAADRPWERIGHLAGAASGGPPDLGARHREHLEVLLGGG